MTRGVLCHAALKVVALQHQSNVRFQDLPVSPLTKR